MPFALGFGRGRFLFAFTASVAQALLPCLCKQQRPRFAMDLFKNIAINLKATGPAAILIVWLLCVAAVGLLGSGDLADRAMNILGIAGGAFLASMSFRTW